MPIPIRSGYSSRRSVSFDNDKSAVSTCEGDHAKICPACLGSKGEMGRMDWNMVARADVKRQWTYDGRPVYVHSGDKMKGDTTGGGIGGV